MTLSVNTSTSASATSSASTGYTVRSGDNLSSIARRHGVSLQALLAANPQIRNPNLIRAGQRLSIPHGAQNRTAATTAQDGRYTVKRGDTLAGIAQAHGLSLDALRGANPQVRDINRIYPGQSLTIPGREANGASHATRGQGAQPTPAPVAHGGLDAATLQARLASTSSKPTLRQGARGQAVMDLQRRLSQLGHNPGPADGVFGPRTDAAVRAFQRSQGIAVDGVVGPQTWGKLANPSAAAPTPAPSGGQGSAALFVDRALAQQGDRYVYGAETNLNDPDPSTFDCSELVQWAAHQAGVTIPDGSQWQEAHCRQHGTIISVNEALHTRGALLFKDGHVAISLGDGVHTIEAMGSRYGVLVADGRNRFRCGGLIPGMRY